VDNAAVVRAGIHACPRVAFQQADRTIGPASGDLTRRGQSRDAGPDDEDVNRLHGN